MGDLILISTPSLPDIPAADLRRRLRRVGLALLVDDDGGTSLQSDPKPSPPVDGWTAARLVLWTGMGAAGVSRGSAFVAAALWEIAESHLSDRAVESLPNQLVDLAVGVGGYELGRRLRKP